VSVDGSSVHAELWSSLRVDSHLVTWLWVCIKTNEPG